MTITIRVNGTEVNDMREYLDIIEDIREACEDAISADEVIDWNEVVISVEINGETDTWTREQLASASYYEFENYFCDRLDDILAGGHGRIQYKPY